MYVTNVELAPQKRCGPLWPMVILGSGVGLVRVTGYPEKDFFPGWPNGNFVL